MKNYELIAELIKLPAGAEVKFSSAFEDDELILTDNQETLVDREITDVSMQNEKILLC